MFEQAYIDQKGIVRWKSNNNIPFEDKLMEFYNDNKISHFDVVRSNDQRDVETGITIAAYRKQMENHVPDAEELFEMRAAFGAGASIVNVITGKRIQL
jgi:hypothetical protein